MGSPSVASGKHIPADFARPEWRITAQVEVE
jgi:hypothetical protein